MRLTASRISLARACSWWARPDVTVPTSTASASAAIGTTVHAVAETEVETGEELDEAEIDEQFRAAAAGRGGEARELTPKERETLEALVASFRLWWSSLVAVSGVEPKDTINVTERPFAIDVVAGTARTLPSSGPRDYSAATATEICGTADLVLQPGGTLVVYDYKTGRGPHRWEDHEDQMRFLGAAAALVHGFYQVRAVVAWITADGVIEDGRDLDSLDVAVTVHELRELHAKVATAEALPGLHCEQHWCPAAAVCPATRALLLAAKLPLDARRHLPIVGDITSNDQALGVLVGLKLIEAWIKERRREVQRYAYTRPVTSPDGQVYMARETTRETPDIGKPEALAALREALGALADEAIRTEVSTSFDAIESAIKARRKAGEKIPVKDTLEVARESLRAAGGLKVSKFDSFAWRKPQPRKEATI